MNNQGYLHNNSLVINSPIFTQQIPGMVLSDQFFDQGPHFWLGRIRGWWTKLYWQTILEFRYISSGKEQVKLDAMTDLSFVIYNDRNLDQSQTNLANKALRLSEYFST
jgi:hypothetical protein